MDHVNRSDPDPFLLALLCIRAWWDDPDPDPQRWNITPPTPPTWGNISRCHFEEKMKRG
jgi:hypothetical protein